MTFIANGCIISRGNPFQDSVQPVTDRTEIASELIRQGAIAVVRLADTEKLIRVVEAVADGGLTAIEITLTTPRAVELISEISSRFGDSILLGVGSVLRAEDARAAIDAGARFVVSPIFKTDIIDTAHARNMPALAGAFTPTEIQAATDAGADIVKVFPAGVVGMAFFKAVLAPMPHCRLMPTGGVTLENAGDWIRAGACAVGIGSALLDKEAIATGAFEILTERAATLLRSIEEARD